MVFLCGSRAKTMLMTVYLYSVFCACDVFSKYNAYVQAKSRVVSRHFLGPSTIEC